MSDEFRRLNERLEALEDARKARAEERARGTAKGADFEAALEERLGSIARGMGDLVERTGADGGDAMTSKKGDLVITIDPTRTRGTSLRIVVEAKDRSMPLSRMTKELADARVNRSAAIALAVFTPYTAPTAVAPLALIGADVYATYDPEADDAVALEAAYRAARILALVTLRDAAVRLDAEAVTRALDDLGRQVDVVRSLKTKLTHIGSTAREVSDALDILRAGVLRSVKELEAQLAIVEDDAASPPDRRPAGSMPACPDRPALRCSRPLILLAACSAPAAPTVVPHGGHVAGSGTAATQHPSAPDGADGSIELESEFVLGGTGVGTTEALEVASSQPVLVTGILLRDVDGGIWFCDALDDGDPPSCASPRLWVRNFPADEAVFAPENAESTGAGTAGGVTWVPEQQLYGVVHPAS